MICSFLSEMTFFGPVIDEAEKQDLIAENLTVVSVLHRCCGTFFLLPETERTDLRH
jgi:hypothetical protein